MYSNCSFWYVLFGSFWAFLTFCALAFVGFLLLIKNAFLTYLVFLQTTSDSRGTPHLTLGLIGIHAATAAAAFAGPMWAEIKFLYSSFGVCLSDIS